MYDCILLNISDGVTDLPAMFNRITECYVNNLLTLDQYHELKQLAIEYASASNDPGIESRLTNMESIINSHTTLIDNLYEMLDALNSNNDENEILLKDPSAIPVYTNGIIAKTDSVWVIDGQVWKSVSPLTYGLCWGPEVLPQYWENISDEYDLTKLNIEE